MTSPAHDRDDDLVAEIRAALAEQDAVPFQARQAARAAFGFRTLDREFELLVLEHDSLLQDSATSRAGDGAAGRELRFAGADFYLEVEVVNGSLIGQLVPPQQVYVSLETTAGSSAAEQTDELGTFLLDGPPVGPVRLTCRTATGRLQTDWFTY